MNIDSSLIAAIAGATSSVIMFITVIILLVQAREVKRATYSQSFKSIYDILQPDDVRNARKFVLDELKDRSYQSWSNEDKQIAEIVCNTYDCVGIMIKSGMIPVHVVADNWGDSLRKTWKILNHMVIDYRTLRNSIEFWNDYQWLANQAEKYSKKLKRGTLNHATVYQ